MKKIFLLLGIAAALGLSACGGMQDTQAAPVEQTAAAQTYKAVLNVDGHKLPVTLRRYLSSLFCRSAKSPGDTVKSMPAECSSMLKAYPNLVLSSSG